MEEDKIQRLHDSLSKLRKSAGLGTDSQFNFGGVVANDAISIIKDKDGKSVREDGLPINALYSNFLKQGNYDPNSKNSASKYGDGRFIKRNFDDCVGEGETPVHDVSKKKKKDSSGKKKKAEAKARKKAEKKAIKLAAKKQEKLEAKRRARKEEKRRQKELETSKPSLTAGMPSSEQQSEKVKKNDISKDIDESIKNSKHDARDSNKMKQGAPKKTKDSPTKSKKSKKKRKKSI